MCYSVNESQKNIILDETHTPKNTYDCLCDIAKKGKSMASESRWSEAGGKNGDEL